MQYAPIQLISIACIIAFIPDSIEEALAVLGRGKFIQQRSELFGGCAHPSKQSDWFDTRRMFLQLKRPQCAAHRLQSVQLWCAK